METVSTEEADIELEREAMRQFSRDDESTRGERDAESFKAWQESRRDSTPEMIEARDAVLSFLRTLCAIPSRARDVVIWRHCGWTWQRIGDAMGGKTRMAAMKFHAATMRANPDLEQLFKPTTSEGEQ
jgi:DNA-directed RNA polymerase specialized sigma24 family protein